MLTGERMIVRERARYWWVFLGALWGFIRPVNTFFALASGLGLILIFYGTLRCSGASRRSCWRSASATQARRPRPSILRARADQTDLQGRRRHRRDFNHHQQLQRRCPLAASRPRDHATSRPRNVGTTRRGNVPALAA
jgi:hypothetical protein